MNGIAIEFRSVTKRFDGAAAPAVDRLDLRVGRGETVALIGASGCGKTTTLKMINRLIEPTSGTILVAERDILSLPVLELRRSLGYVIQQVGLFPHMTVAANIAIVPQLLGWDKKRIAERVDELLTLVHLPPDQYRGRRPMELSGGQQQRVGVARALAADPPILLMDEPFGALDPITRASLQNEVLEIQRKLRKAIVIVTHDMEEAIRLGDRIIVMEKGRIAQEGTPAELLLRPATPFIASLLGEDRAIKLLQTMSVGDLMQPGGQAGPTAPTLARRRHAARRARRLPVERRRQSHRDRRLRLADRSAGAATPVRIPGGVSVSGILRIALSQGWGQPASLDESLSGLAQAADRAARGGAALLLAPELALSGYGDPEATRRLSLDVEDATMRVGEIARACGIAIATGYCERTEAGFANAALLVGADGRRMLNYRKMHLWGGFEEAIFQPGGLGDLVDIGGLKTGILICFDLDHPVTMQDLAARGADLVLVLSATTRPYDVVPMAQVPARAYENALFVAFCNQAGPQNGFDLVGRSTVCAPDGSVVARAGSDAGEMIFADLDRSAFEAYRQAHRYADLLRRDLYPAAERLDRRP